MVRSHRFDHADKLEVCNCRLPSAKPDVSILSLEIAAMPDNLTSRLRTPVTGRPTVEAPPRAATAHQRPTAVNDQENQRKVGSSDNVNVRRDNASRTPFGVITANTTNNAQPNDFEHFDELRDEWASEDVMKQAFREGHCVPMLPAVTQLTGSDLLQFLKTPSPATPHWAANALAVTTRQTHRRMLAALTAMPADLQRYRLATALSEMMSRTREQRKWTWATTLRNLCTLQGALALLPMYRAVEAGIALKQDPVWSQTIQSIQRKAQEEVPRVPVSMTPEIFKRTLALEKRGEHRIVLQLMYFTSARVGCVLSLQKEDITFNRDTSISVRFHRGKGVKVRGPYTVHGPPLHEHVTEIKNFVDSAPRRLFTIKAPDMLQTFRLADRTMEARSVRRGSLQTMAHAKVPLDTLMLYSGHTNEKTLLRYLGWGSSAGHRQQQMAAAGAVLVPRRH
jgi:integrase